MERIVRPGSIWFVISNSWLEKWQKHVYMDYITPGTKPLHIPDSERISPGPISNEDIILPTGKQYLLEIATAKIWQNIVLKPDLKEG